MAFHLGSALWLPSGEIVTGYNHRRKTFDLSVKESMHAEMHVIRKFTKKQLKGAILVVVRVNAKGELCSSKPCSKCHNTLKNLGITVYYID